MDSTSHVSTASTLTHLKNNPIGDQTEEDLMVHNIPEASALEMDEYLRDDTGEEWWKEDGTAESKNATRMKGHWTAILVGSGLFLVVAAVVTLFPRKISFPSPQFIQTGVTQAIDKVKTLFEESHGTIDVPLAEELVRRWHVAKSEALGSEHDIDKLAEVLEGNMLKQWKQRAHTVQTDGWHWEYTLQDLTVDKVSVGRDGRRATIEARIKEKAELIDSGRKADWYSTSYTVQYDLVMKKQGWRISAARVVYESS